MNDYRTVDGIRERHCNRGAHWLPHTAEHFYPDHRNPFGLQVMCKECLLIIGREHSRKRTAHYAAQLQYARESFAKARSTYRRAA